jgi:hypothetical protein
MSLRLLTYTFWIYYVLKLLLLETITFSDASLSDINVVLCYVLSQYRLQCDCYLSRGLAPRGSSLSMSAPLSSRHRMISSLSTSTAWSSAVRPDMLRHCQRKFYTSTKILFMYSFSGNSAASAPISTFMCL